MQEILLSDQKKLNMKGVEKIISSTPTQSVVQTNTSKVIVSGNNLEVKKLDIENKEAIIEGEISNLKFLVKTEKKSLLRRIFK